MPTKSPALPTVGVIAEHLKRPIHAVEYVIKSRNIEPIGRAGNARVFSEASVEHIASELRRIESDKERSPW